MFRVKARLDPALLENTSPTSRPACPEWPTCDWTLRSSGRPTCRSRFRNDRWRERRGEPPGRFAALRRDARGGRRQPGDPGQPHGRPDRSGRGRQVQPAGAAGRRTEDAGWRDPRARWRHARPPPPPGGLPAHRLHAQGLGKNLYPTLSVFENVDFFGRLFGHDKAERERRIADLLQSTGLAPFAERPAGKLSGGMKQARAVLRADPRSRPADPRRADHRRRPAVAQPVLGADRPYPRGPRRHERAGRHRLHGGSRALRLAGGDG